MREPDFNALATNLLQQGIVPRHVHRTVNELRDHYEDLVDSAVDAGASSEAAHCIAAQQLGSMDGMSCRATGDAGIRRHSAPECAGTLGCEPARGGTGHYIDAAEYAAVYPAGLSVLSLLSGA